MVLNPYEMYKSNAVSGTSNEQLLIMLLDGAVKYTKIAILALKREDKERAHNELVRVQSIFTELIVTLDTTRGDFTKDLINIYDFIRTRLIEANMKKDITIIEETLPIIEEVRDMWCEVKKIYDSKK